MFSVCGVIGQSFRGSLEKLIAIPTMGAARRSRGINREGGELRPEVRVSGRDNREDGQSQKAAQPYRQMLRVSSERAPILHAYQLMCSDVMSLRPSTRVEDAWRPLATPGEGQAPVLGKTLRPAGPVSVQGLLTIINAEADTVPDILTRCDILRALVNDPPLSLWA